MNDHSDSQFKVPFQKFLSEYKWYQMYSKIFSIYQLTQWQSHCLWYSFLGRSQHSTSSVVTRLWHAQYGAWVLVKVRDFPLLNIKTGFGAHLASYSVVTDFLPREWSCWSVNLITQLHLVLSLTVSGATFLIPLCTFHGMQGHL
jgi:hypothetical protein